jgi:hypothetical protein
MSVCGPQGCLTAHGGHMRGDCGLWAVNAAQFWAPPSCVTGDVIPCGDKVHARKGAQGQPLRPTQDCQSALIFQHQTKGSLVRFVVLRRPSSRPTCSELSPALSLQWFAVRLLKSKPAWPAAAAAERRLYRQPFWASRALGVGRFLALSRPACPIWRTTLGMNWATASPISMNSSSRPRPLAPPT